MLVRFASHLGGVAGGLLLFAMAAGAADLPTKAPARAGCVQAVDGVNGKVSAFGGSANNYGLYGGSGSLAMPLGCEFGAQIDGSAASFDKQFLGTVAGHLFWRDPSKGLVGAYGAYTYWNQVGGVRAAHVGPEAEFYMGRWTLQGVAGVEFGTTASGTIGSLIQTYEVKTRFFDQINLNYYVQDNLKVYGGHRYLGGKNALALGTEYGIPMSRGTMAALFAEGNVGEGSFHGIWGGLRVYFGHSDKTLIRRNREDDPTDWSIGYGSAISNGGSTAAPAAPACLPPKQIINGVCQNI